MNWHWKSFHFLLIKNGDVTMRRVVGLFDTHERASEVQQDLIQGGIPANSIRLVDKGTRHQEKGFWDSVAEFFGMEDTDIYEEATERGGTLVITEVPEVHADTAVSAMRRHDAIDIQRRATEWRQTGWQPGARRAEGVHRGKDTRRAAAQEEQTFPVTEEQLNIGKRRTEHGGVRVYTEIEEVPATADVELREEKVRVERRAANRPAKSADFQERTVEATEIHEEPIVSKEARVIEEVVVAKDVDQRTERVEDTVRRTKVRVEELDEDFRKDYSKSFAGTGYTYDQVSPAYNYGRDLALDERYGDREWSAVEPEARRHFEQRNPGKWEKFGSAVRRGYDQTRARTH
jgi:uncharacterized protein (TIGR02271 family)